MKARHKMTCAAFLARTCNAGLTTGDLEFEHIVDHTVICLLRKEG